MIQGVIAIVAIVVVYLSLTRRAVLLPILIIYAFLPIRFWTDASLPVPGFGSLLLDPLIALFLSILMLGRLLINQKTGREGLHDISLLLVFVVFAVISALIMGMMGQFSGFKMLVRFIYPILVFLIILHDYQKEIHADYIVSLFIGVGVVASVFVFAANYLGISSWRVSAGVDRFAGLGAVSDYAYLMALLAVLSYTKMNLTKRKVLYGFLTMLFVAQMMMTVTRGAIFACIIAIVAIELFSSSRALTTRLIMPIVLLGFLSASVTFYEPLRERIFATHYKDVEHNSGATLSQNFSTSFSRSGRESAWIYVVTQVFSDYHMFFGFGIGSAEINIVRDLGGIPHNEYMRVLYEMGAIGLLLFVMSFFQLWKVIRRLSGEKYKNVESANLVEWCSVGIIVLYMAGALVDNMINKYKNMGMPLFVFVALVLVQLKSVSKHNKNKPEQEQSLQESHSEFTGVKLINK